MQPPKELVDEKPDSTNKIADENMNKPNRTDINESPANTTLDDTSNQLEVYCLVGWFFQSLKIHPNSLKIFRYCRSIESIRPRLFPCEIQIQLHRVHRIVVVAFQYQHQHQKLLQITLTTTTTTKR